MCSIPWPVKIENFKKEKENESEEEREKREWEYVNHILFQVHE